MTATRVAATCSGCGDEHLLADRPVHQGDPELAKLTDCTTECPSCETTTYSTDVIELGDIKSDEARIRDAIDVKGVGAQTETNILEAFTTWNEFQSADLAELKEIGGVGTANGQRILDNRPTQA